MSDGIGKLKLIGAQKISEQTHIAKQYIDAILRQNYESLSKVQLGGFISILEREYKVDLSDIKSNALNTFAGEEEKPVFIAEEKKKNYTPIYIAIAVFIVIIGAIYTFVSQSENITETKIESVEIPAVVELNKTHETDTKNIVKKVEDKNITNNELNLSTKIVKAIKVKKTIKKQVKQAYSFKVISHVNLWIGYIDLKSFKKHQTVLRGTLKLNPKKTWLMTLGHGRVSFDVNGKLKKYNTSKKIRFIYRNGELKEIPYSEFKRLNRGRAW